MQARCCAENETEIIFYLSLLSTFLPSSYSRTSNTLARSGEVFVLPEAERFPPYHIDILGQCNQACRNICSDHVLLLCSDHVDTSGVDKDESVSVCTLGLKKENLINSHRRFTAALSLSRYVAIKVLRLPLNSSNSRNFSSSINRSTSDASLDKTG